MKIVREHLRRFALLLLALESQQKIVGRTRLQKMVYLANQCGWSAIGDYVFYQYGPYSEWLARELDNLKSSGIVTEELYESDNERTVYLYSLTEKGKSLLNTILKELDAPNLVDKTRGLFGILSKYNSDDLEIMASLLEISRDKDLDKDGIVKTTLRLKPRFTDEQIRKHLDVFPLIERFKQLPA